MPKKKKETPYDKCFKELQAELQPIFPLYDGNGDGLLTFDELDYFLFGITLPMEDSRLREVVKEMSYSETPFNFNNVVGLAT